MLWQRASRSLMVICGLAEDSNSPSPGYTYNLRQDTWQVPRDETTSFHIETGCMQLVAIATRDAAASLFQAGKGTEMGIWVTPTRTRTSLTSDKRRVEDQEMTRNKKLSKSWYL